MPEKLLTIREVAEYLKISEEEAKRLVDIGEIPAYRIGGSFLRFRREQIDGIKPDIEEIEEKEPERGKVVLDRTGHSSHAVSDMEKEILRHDPLVRQYEYTNAEKVKDFFYFNDFYIISAALVVLLGLLIFLT